MTTTNFLLPWWMTIVGPLRHSNIHSWWVAEQIPIGHIFIGYHFGYKVLDLATKRIHVSEDVQFYENVFPSACSPDHSSFPSVLKNMYSRFTFMFHVDNTVNECQMHTENTPPSVEQIDTSHNATNDAPLLVDLSLSPHQPHQSSFPEQTSPPSTSSSHLEMTCT